LYDYRIPQFFAYLFYELALKENYRSVTKVNDFIMLIQSQPNIILNVDSSFNVTILLRNFEYLFSVHYRNFY